MATVLVVDDDSDILSALSEALMEERWTVAAALSARDAVCEAGSRHVDVVLCDVLLGADGDGLTLRERFLSRGLGDLPFVFTTASMKQIERLGGELVLRKPFAVAELIEVLNTALSQHASAPVDLDRILPLSGIRAAHGTH